VQWHRITQLFYSKLPRGIEDMQVILVDPMLATGGSAIQAIQVCVCVCVCVSVESERERERESKNKRVRGQEKQKQHRK
jgi:hypothetical protein